jgi:hydrogenase nickel incorporation protein HypB
LEVFEFDVDYFRSGLEMLNSDAPLFIASCRTGDGINDWVTWLLSRLR